MTKKHRQQKAVVTTARIEGVLRQEPTLLWSRLQICKALGRQKTSYMVRQIERAVSEARIWKELHTDPVTGLPTWFYIWAEIEYTEEFWPGGDPFMSPGNLTDQDELALERSRLERIEFGQ